MNTTKLEYDVIALDVDGTLLDDNHAISERTRLILNHAWKCGVKVALCTGRGPESTLPVLHELGIHGVIVSNNGATVIDSTDRSVLHADTFALADIREQISYCRKFGVHFDVCTVFDLYVEQLTPELLEMYESYLVQPRLLSRIEELQEPLVKFTVFGPEAQMDQVEKDWGNGEDGFAYIRSGVSFNDVMRAGVSKGKALRRLCDRWGVAASRVVAMGNYYNDLDMLQYAGVGVAMSNSPEDVRLAADRVTCSNNEEGVYHALLELGFQMPTNA